MPNTTSTYEPLVLVDTADLPEEEWLEYRRRGIGGSDAAAILGVSPFATARDLYYDKLKVVSYEDGESNWVQKKVGHLLEDLVAEIFHVKTGFEIYQVKKMFYHPVYTYMLADIDYFIRLPNGKTAILEIKTTNYNAKDHWWCDGQEIVPVNYEIQGRHYMCVMNMDEVYFCCLYGNNENEVIIRHIDRDPDYFALEDNYARLQRRLFRMFGAEAAENLYFATHCKTANSGLEDQIRSFMREHPNTGLIIIDTLKRVREVGGADFSYSSDYDIVARLKTVADSYKVTMVIVHHTRKLEADDKFDMIAGTNGLLGAADGGFVLSKEKRTSNAAVLDVTGRDQEDQRLHLNKNPETLVWELESVETELWQEPPDPFLESIAAFLSSAGERWEGTASELCCLLNLDCKPNVLSLRLSISSVRLLRDHDIHYKASRNHGGRKISLWKEMEPNSVSKGDDRDGLLVGGGEV